MYTDCQHKNSGYFAGIFEIGYYRWTKKSGLWPDWEEEIFNAGHRLSISDALRNVVDCRAAS
jgi:hypothetical protein